MNDRTTPSSPTFPCTQVGLVRRGFAKRFARAAVATFAGSLALTFATWLLPEPGHWHTARVAIAGYGALSAIVLAMIGFVLQLDFFRWRGALLVDGDTLVIDNGTSQQRIPLSNIEEGCVIPKRRGSRVELTLKNGNVIAADLPDSVENADLVLRAAHVDVSRQRCRLDLADPVARVVVALSVTGTLLYVGMFALPFFLVTMPDGPGFLAWLCGALFLSYFAVKATSLPDVTVGTDGLAFRKGFRETFVSFDDLQGVRPAGLKLRLVHKDGRVKHISSLAGIGPARYEALMLRIRAAFAARANAESAPLQLLDRNGRSLAEWQKALGDLARRGSTYRSASLSIEDLRAVLDSPASTPERRIGAAIALAAQGEDRARIRIAAEACANEKVRIALEQVSAGEVESVAVERAVLEGKV